MQGATASPPLDAIPARTEPSASRNSQNNYPSLMLTLKKVLKTIYFLWAAIPGGVVFETTFQVEGGALRVPTGAGLGVEVDEEKVRHASRGWFRSEERRVGKECRSR